MPEHLYGHMVQEYFVRRVRELQQDRLSALAEVRTQKDVMKLRAQTRRKLRLSFGPQPVRTPLSARVTGTLTRKSYVIEKIMYESRPDFPVTANLYIPRRHKGPFPCVLGTCGHSGTGKAEPFYQAFCQGLAEKGFLVLIYDPISQGERLQYPGNEGKAHPKGCCQEHNMMGNQMRLFGDYVGAWRLWDGIRGLDYLLSRPEADPTRVGVTGNSGGGTMSTYLCGLEDRFTMAAPSCFVTTYLLNLENELPADSEQIPPKIIGMGLDMSAFFIAQIPRPVLLLGQKNDYFDRRGLTQTYQELRRLYAILGAEDNVQLFIGPSDHGYRIENREAMYGFFVQQAGLRGNQREPKTVEESPEELAASPEGQVHNMGVKRVFDFNKQNAQTAAAARKKLSHAKLREAIAGRLALPERDAAPHFRVMRQRGNDTKRYARHSAFAVETEPGIKAILHVFSKTDGYFHFPELKEAVLYLPHTSSLQDVTDGQTPDDDTLFALDVRGMGETIALSCGAGDFFAPYGTDYFYTSYGEMIGEPYCGRRVHDVLATLDLLKAQGYRRVHLYGRGLGAVIAAFAACMHPLVKQVTLRNALLSYHELTQVPVQSWPLSSMVSNALDAFDLPDCFKLLSNKSLKIVEPWDGQMEACPKAKLRSHLKALGIDAGLIAW